MDLDSDVSQPSSPQQAALPAEEQPQGQAVVEVVPLVYAASPATPDGANAGLVNFKAFRSKARQEATLQQSATHIVRVQDLRLTEAQLQHSRHVQMCALALCGRCMAHCVDYMRLIMMPLLPSTLEMNGPFVITHAHVHLPALHARVYASTHGHVSTVVSIS